MQQLCLRKNGDTDFFYCDSKHPYPYWEDYSCQGVYFSFLAPNASKEEKKCYESKLRTAHDVVHIYWLE